jgi:beta-N-acetylhexosaminidase
VSAAPRLLRKLLALALLLAVPVGCSSRPGPVNTPSGPPGGQGAADPARQAADAVARMSDADLVGQVLMPAVNLDDPPPTAAAMIKRYHPGGVILMGPQRASSGAADAAAVATFTAGLQAAAGGYPARLLIGTDQEYGWVTRIPTGMIQLPGAMAFGAAGRPDLTGSAWQEAGTELAAIGVNVDFAPDADVIGGAGNTVIGSRSFGADPTPVAQQVTAVVQGLQRAGVAATIKHFPGHGHTTVDSHTDLPVLAQSRAELDRNDLPPFQAGIAAGAWLVMAGHLDVRSVDPGVPATFSHRVLTDLLRGELGFQGVTVTDALNMQPAQEAGAGAGAVRALMAGADLLLMPADLGAAYQALLAGLADGQVSRARLVEAATRVLTLRFRLTARPRPGPEVLADPANAAAAGVVAAAAVTVLQGSCDGPLITGPVRVTGSTGRETQVGWLRDALLAQGLSVVDTGGLQVHLVGHGDTATDLAATATVTVAMDSPYLLGSARSPVRVATYSATRAAMDALAAVIAGRVAAPGRSPVPVNGLPTSACLR